MKHKESGNGEIRIDDVIALVPTVLVCMAGECGMYTRPHTLLTDPV